MRTSSARTHAADRDVDSIFDLSRQQPALKKERRNDKTIHNSYHNNRPLPAAELIQAWRSRVGGCARSGPDGLGQLRAARRAPLQIIPQAQGHSTEKHVNLHVNGPSDTLQALLVFQPGAETGWHIHPGPVVVVVKSGALTETHSNGCTTVHPTGSVFFESAGEVHNATNRTNGVAEVYATFLSPTGAQPLIPVPDPGRVCRSDGN